MGHAYKLIFGIQDSYCIPRRGIAPIDYIARENPRMAAGSSICRFTVYAYGGQALSLQSADSLEREGARVPHLLEPRDALFGRWVSRKHAEQAAAKRIQDKQMGRRGRRVFHGHALHARFEFAQR